MAAILVRALSSATLIQPVTALIGKTLVVNEYQGLSAGIPINILDSSPESVIASPAYVSGSVVVPLVASVVNSHASGTPLSWPGSTMDPQRGQSQDNFLSDLPAVAQLLSQRLKLLTGEWFANLSDGTPLFQSILGVSNTSAGVGLILRQRILTTPFVTGVSNLVVSYNAASRKYAFSCLVSTAFGNIQLTSQPLPGANAILT